jgi:site-specific recombinase XerD
MPSPDDLDHRKPILTDTETREPVCAVNTFVGPMTIGFPVLNLPPPEEGYIGDSPKPLLEVAIAEPADRHPAAVYLASLGSEKSRASQRSALEAIARELGAGGDWRALPWAAIGYQHVAALRARLTGKYAPATANRFLCALRGVLREAVRLGQMSAEDCTRACDVRGVKGSREPAGRALSAAELAALFRACDVATNAGARDAALLALLYGAGLRRAEAVGLDLGHVDPVTGALRVLGKGNKERVTYAAPGALRAHRAWLSRRGAEPGPLLWPVDKAGRMRCARLSDRAAASVLERIAARAGVEDVTCHDMRRTMISDLLDAAGDIATVQRMVGHASVNTTARYDRRGDRAKVKTAELLQVPFEATREAQ